jgi:ABC-2 type transport system ATP-binding protein
MLQARRLTKYYGALAAVRDLTFDVPPGAVVGLLGPNGSGKSTTVRILAGLQPPSSGSIELDGCSADADPIEYRRGIGYVPEEAYLYSYMTGPEYLTLTGRLRGIPPRRLQEKIDALLELLHLEDARHAVMAGYSKGMRQKVLLSAALLHNPDILILDEPNSGLDVTSSLVLRSLVKALARAGKMIVFSSHVMESVEVVCSDVIILYGGRCVAHDSVDRLRDLTRQPSLEEVFRKLAVDEDVEVVAGRVVEVMTQ